MTTFNRRPGMPPNTTSVNVLVREYLTNRRTTQSRTPGRARLWQLGQATLRAARQEKHGPGKICINARVHQNPETPREHHTSLRRAQNPPPTTCERPPHQSLSSSRGNQREL